MKRLEERDLGYIAFIQDQARSPLQKYQDLVIGDRKLWNLMKYEVLTFGLASMPGLLGLVLRQWFYPVLFKKMGHKVIIGQGVTVRHPAKVSIGSNTVIDDYCGLVVKGSENSCIDIGDNVFIGRNTLIKTREGRIEIQDFANIGTFCRIASIGRTRIGKYVGIAAYCYVGMSSHRTDSITTPIILQEIDNKGGVTIEDGVWIGAGSKILDGVTIGRNSVICVGSVVTQDIAPYRIAAGVPARVIDKRKPVPEERT